MILGNIIVYSMKMDIDFEIRFISVFFIYMNFKWVLAN